VTPSIYGQTAKALARIDESLALCGTDKSKIPSAIGISRFRIRVKTRAP
jgi:hypothetical protein